MAANIRTTVPMPLVLDDERQWPDVIETLKRIGAERVLLFTSALPVPLNSMKQYRDRLGTAAHQPPSELGILPALGFYELWAELFSQRRDALLAAGIAEAGIWMGQTLGHGGGLSGAVSAEYPGPGFQLAQNAMGEEEPGLFCPLCPKLTDHLSAALRILSRAKPAVILFDDDFRPPSHPKIRTGCYCPLHQAEFHRRGIAESDMRALAETIAEGPASPDRTTWWQVQNDAMVSLARTLGEAIHSIGPAIRVGLCSAHNAGEDNDLIELLCAFAGTTRPLVRTCGAPYWERGTALAKKCIELVRLQRSRLRSELPAAEVMCEGDTFPHLTSRCSAAMLDAYIQAMTASGSPEVLTYALPYYSPVHFEPGYADILAKNRDRYNVITELIPPDCHDRGLSVPWKARPVRSRTLKKGDLSLELNNPTPQEICAELGVPVAYDDEDGPVLLVGWQAEMASDAELARWADRGLLLDVHAGIELARRGIACGLKTAEPAEAPILERFHDHALNGKFANGTVGLFSNAENFYYQCELHPAAITLSSFRRADDSVWGPGVALFENEAGQRFVLFPWDLRVVQAQNELQLMVSHARRGQLLQVTAWAARRPLPAAVDAPNVQVMVRRTPGRDRTVVTVLNCGTDVLRPVVRVDAGIGRPNIVQFLGPEGSEIKDIPAQWSAEGDALLLPLPCVLPPLGFCAVSIQSDHDHDA